MYFHLHEEGNKVELAMNLSKVFTITEKAFEHYVNQTALPLSSLHQCTNFMSTYHGLMRI